MSFWLTIDILLLLSILPCALGLLRSAGLNPWAVAIQTCGLIAVLSLPMLGHALKYPFGYDLPVALSLISFPSGMLLARFIHRWL